MHLDTVFSIIDKDLVLIYPDALQVPGEEVYVYSTTLVDSEFKTRSEQLPGGFLGFLDVLRNELKVDVIQRAETGNNEPRVAAREQYADATNVLAIGPREAVAYKRNEATNRALETSHGVKIFTVTGSELVRGRGGPRCMALPLRRRNVW